LLAASVSDVHHPHNVTAAIVYSSKVGKLSGSLTLTITLRVIPAFSAIRIYIKAEYAGFTGWPPARRTSSW